MQRPALKATLVALLGVMASEPEPFPREVDEGTTLRRTFAMEYSLELEVMELTVDGEPHPAGDLEGVRIELAAEKRVVVEDDFGPSAWGRPRRLVRYFDELTGEQTRSISSPDGDSDTERSAGSDLEGRSVLFALGPEDDGEHVVSWEDDAGDDELLEGLREDMDLRAFLPTEPVEEGDSWELPGSAYLLLTAPGGIELIGGDETELERRMIAEGRESTDGEIEATYRGERRVEGVAVSVIELRVAVTSEASMPVPTGDEAEVEVAVRYSGELEGELLWNIEGGHLFSLSLSGLYEFEELMTVSLGDHEREQLKRFSGPIEQSVRVEPAE